MVIDLAAINDAVFAQLKTDAAGAAVRAALVAWGASASSIIPAHWLRREPRPARPLLVLRGGVLSGQSGGMRGVVNTWWIYDDPPQGYARINALVPLVEAAYPLEWLAWGETYISPVGQEGEDGTLGGLFFRPLTLTYRRLS